MMSRERDTEEYLQALVKGEISFHVAASKGLKPPRYVEASLSLLGLVAHNPGIEGYLGFFSLLKVA